MYSFVSNKVGGSERLLNLTPCGPGTYPEETQGRTRSGLYSEGKGHCGPQQGPPGSGRGQEPASRVLPRKPCVYCSICQHSGRTVTDSGLEANSLTGHRGDQVNVLEAMLTCRSGWATPSPDTAEGGAAWPQACELVFDLPWGPGSGPPSPPHPGHPTPTAPPVALQAVRPLSSPGPVPAPVTPPVWPPQEGASPSRRPSSGVLF